MEKWKLVGLPGLSPFRNFNISGSSFSVSAQKSQGKFDETRKILIQVNKMKRKREQSLVTGKNYMQLHNKVWKITEFSSHCFLWRKECINLGPELSKKKLKNKSGQFSVFLLKMLSRSVWSINILILQKI